MPCTAKTTPWLLPYLLLSGSVLAGCGGGGSPYPEVEPVSIYGRSGACESCGQPLPKIIDENLLTVKGNQYVVCDEACSAKLEDDIQNERHGGHTHEH